MYSVYYSVHEKNFLCALGESSSYFKTKMIYKRLKWFNKTRTNFRKCIEKYEIRLKIETTIKLYFMYTKYNQSNLAQITNQHS